MRLKAPRVPPAATAAFEAATGPRVLPGTYTVKMTRGTETYTTPLVVNLDPRAKYTVADRKLNFDAVMRVYNLLGDMTFDVERINGVRDELADARREARGATIRCASSSNHSLPKCEEMRKKIVATTEGGAITGEERIREHTTQLYGELNNYEGRPADYQLARIDSLTARTRRRGQGIRRVRRQRPQRERIPRYRRKNSNPFSPSRASSGTKPATTPIPPARPAACSGTSAISRGTYLNRFAYIQPGLEVYRWEHSGRISPTPVACSRRAPALPRLPFSP